VFKSITHRSFWANLLAIAIISLVLLVAFIVFLEIFTHHNETVKVPSVKGMDIAEATRLLKSQRFEVSVEDSAFRDNLPKLSVVYQSPEAGDEVKTGRTVYLTINKVIPTMIDMPNLLGLQFKFAESSIAGLGLHLGDTIYKPDFARNTVLDILVGGLSVKAGAKIPVGTVVSLVLGGGVAETQIPVPDLFGMRLTDARVVLEANGVVMGSVVPNEDVTDTAAAFIYRQSPAPVTVDGIPVMIRSGQTMDVWVGKQIPARTDSAGIRN
jgi:eukaryotic-like serine/threonine-protein kinase